MLGIMRSASTMSGDSFSRQASAASPLSASAQANPSDDPTVVHSLRMLWWSSTTMNRTCRSSLTVSPGLSKDLFHGDHQLHHAKRLFDVRHSGADQRFHGVVIHRVSGDEQHSVFE